MKTVVQYHPDPKAEFPVDTVQEGKYIVLHPNLPRPRLWSLELCKVGQQEELSFFVTVAINAAATATEDGDPVWITFQAVAIIDIRLYGEQLYLWLLTHEGAPVTLILDEAMDNFHATYFLDSTKSAQNLCSERGVPGTLLLDETESGQVHGSYLILHRMIKRYLKKVERMNNMLHADYLAHTDVQLPSNREKTPIVVDKSVPCAASRNVQWMGESSQTVTESQEPTPSSIEQTPSAPPASPLPAASAEEPPVVVASRPVPGRSHRKQTLQRRGSTSRGKPSRACMTLVSASEFISKGKTGIFSSHLT